MWPLYIVSIVVLLAPVGQIARGNMDQLRLTALSGDRQGGVSGEILAEPIIARLVDNAGNGIFDQAVTFRVRRGDGYFIDATGLELRRLVTFTDSNGDASIEFRMGSGGDLVCASTLGVRRPAQFSLLPSSGGTRDCHDAAPAVIRCTQYDVALNQEIRGCISK